MSTYDAMRQATNWEDTDQVAQFFAENLLYSRVSLVLGAGISRPFGLPSWGALLSKLKGDHEPPSDYATSSPDQQASYILKEIYGGDQRSFRDAVHSILYENFPLTSTDIMNKPLLTAIGALIMASSRGSVTEIITFNFDNVLEQYLAYFGFTTDSTCEAICWKSTKDVVIHHPHGFIPFNGEGASDELVFDQASFLKILHNDNPWRKKIAATLSSTIPIFIGLSGDDSHLITQLEAANQVHIARLKEKLPYWGIWFTTDTTTLAARNWENKGIYPVKISGWDKTDVQDFLLKICQLAAVHPR